MVSINPLLHALIELPGNSEKGLSQRFLWMFPKPIYGQFATLEPIDKIFREKIGKYKSNIDIKGFVNVHMYIVKQLAG